MEHQNSNIGNKKVLCYLFVLLQCVPLIVETCTRIVEERGIENQGIYRVPGNSCAVNTLRDELNRVGRSFLSNGRLIWLRGA